MNTNYTFTLFATALSALLFSLPTLNYASDTTSDTSIEHRIGLGFNIGEFDSEAPLLKSIDSETNHWQLTYTANFKSGLYIGAGYLSGQSGKLLDAGNFLGKQRVDYNAIALQAGYEYSTSEKHALYIEAMVLDHSVESTADLKSDSGVGWGVGSGWRYQLADNVDVSLGLQLLDLSNDIQITSTAFSVGIGF